MSQVNIVYPNEVYSKVSCDRDVALELNDLFTFDVEGARFTPAYKNKFWDGKIRLFSTRTGLIYRGLTQHIINHCKEMGYDWSLPDQDSNFSREQAEEFIKTLNIPEKFTPREYQIDAFHEAIRDKRKLLLSPTASGKSLIIYMLTRWINAPTLIVVPTINLVSQLRDDFIDYGFDSPECFHTIFSGIDPYTQKNIAISTWQSLHKLPPEYFHRFDMVIGDEAHLFKAKSLTTIMTSLINTKYRIGTTGTLDGSATNKLVLEGLFGPVKVVTTTTQLMEDKHVSPLKIKCILLKHKPEVCKASSKADYKTEIENLINNTDRNRFIRNLTLSLDGNTLVLYQYVEKHGEVLYNMIKKHTTKPIFFVHGKIEAEIRNQIRRIVENEKSAIIVASYGTFSTGVNITNLHNIIFASPYKARIKVLQSIGRVLRLSKQKEVATLYDIADDLKWKKRENFSLKHFLERMKIYTSESFKFRIYKVDL